MPDTNKPETENTTTEPEAAEPEPDEGQLSEGGKRALAAERQARKQAEKEAHELRDKVTALERAELRRTIAAEKGLTDEQARHLAGDDKAAMEASADELVAAFREDGDDHRRRPTERLRPGAVPGAEPEDFSRLAERVRQGW
jgi:hypothetical protein